MWWDDSALHTRTLGTGSPQLKRWGNGDGKIGMVERTIRRRTQTPIELNKIFEAETPPKQQKVTCGNVGDTKTTENIRRDTVLGSFCVG